MRVTNSTFSIFGLVASAAMGQHALNPFHLGILTSGKTAADLNACSVRKTNNTCTSDLLRDWGLDLEEHQATSRRNGPMKQPSLEGLSTVIQDLRCVRASR